MPTHVIHQGGRVFVRVSLFIYDVCGCFFSILGGWADSHFFGGLKALRIRAFNLLGLVHRQLRAILFNSKANEKIAKIASAHRRKYNNIKAFFCDIELSTCKSPWRMCHQVSLKHKHTQTRSGAHMHFYPQANMSELPPRPWICIYTDI